jgi:hypothetical protein
MHISVGFFFAEDKTAMIAFEIPPNEEGKASNSLSSTLQVVHRPASLASQSRLE